MGAGVDINAQRNGFFFFYNVGNFSKKSPLDLPLSTSKQ
jgi:hypothetical protein